jgi:hypothetical protein
MCQHNLIQPCSQAYVESSVLHSTLAARRSAQPEDKKMWQPLRRHSVSVTAGCSIITQQWTKSMTSASTSKPSTSRAKHTHSHHKGRENPTGRNPSNSMSLALMGKSSLARVSTVVQQRPRLVKLRHTCLTATSTCQAEAQLSNSNLGLRS